MGELRRQPVMPLNPPMGARTESTVQRLLDKLPNGPAGHPMVCGARFPDLVGDHEHVCHQPVRRPHQTDGIPKHTCDICDCTWITVEQEARA